ncbi:WASH complex subunit 3-like isoform X2 [Ptychodera flava]|uniref:WASH complex subunit 3-like isoform X2 n=1 Tax=Ptychodera flava TaxID=63121 RepID=UPI00396AAA81
MDEDGLPIVGSGVDLTKVEAIHQKRMLAFLNHFITHTVRFLNKFSCVCEEKLETLNLRMQKLDTTLSILEAKLASIPGLDDVTAATAPSGGSTAPSSQAPATSTPQAAPTPQESQSTSEEPAAAEPVASDNPVSRDPRFAHYFKMLNVGIPAQAIKLKMQSEGVDPDILDDPNAPAPPKEAGGSDSDFSDDDSQSSFSDD